MHEKIIALDIGSVRIGVAISDALGLMAHPLKTLKWKNEKEFVADVNSILLESHAEKVLVGIPYTMKGENSQQTEKVLKLVEYLKQNLTHTVETIDERLTTQMAHNMLRDVGKKASKNRHIIDQIAAVNILQLYLDKKPS
jgi:putative Holliday junction resolvase